MTSDVDRLELSTRTYNALVNAGIETIAEILAVTREDVDSWKGAGTKTWYEISDIQGDLIRSDSDRAMNQLIQLSHMWNELVDLLDQDPRSPHIKFAMEEYGKIVIWKSAT